VWHAIKTINVNDNPGRSLVIRISWQGLYQIQGDFLSTEPQFVCHFAPLLVVFHSSVMVHFYLLQQYHPVPSVCRMSWYFSWSLLSFSLNVTKCVAGIFTLTILLHGFDIMSDFLCCERSGCEWAVLKKLPLQKCYHQPVMRGGDKRA